MQVVLSVAVRWVFEVDLYADFYRQPAISGQWADGADLAVPLCVSANTFMCFFFMCFYIFTFFLTVFFHKHFYVS